MPSLANHQSNSFTIVAEDIVAHFNRPITVNEHGCWLWQGATDKRGYARFGGNCLVHGVTFRMAGFICDGDKELCHTCPHRNCVNPYHLYAGTHKENMQDAANAGVMGQGPRKVTMEQIELIIQMYRDGHSQASICRRFNLSQAWFTKFKNGGLNYAKLS